MHETKDATPDKASNLAWRKLALHNANVNGRRFPALAMFNIATLPELAQLKASMSRRCLYVCAEKKFHFIIYKIMEWYIFLSFLILLWNAIFMNERVLQAHHINSVFVVVIGIAHYMRELAWKPWLIMAATIEAALAWLIFEFGLALVIPFQDYWLIAVYIFIVRLWQRGEVEVAFEAYYRRKGRRYLRF